ncbi:MAG: hypothetical protein ACLFVJ_04695 [Persicimonas sp.]
MLTATGNRIRYRIAAEDARGFCEEFVVECPKCNGCATLIPWYHHPDGDKEQEPVPRHPPEPSWFKCAECSLHRTWLRMEVNMFYALVDWFRELELYLQTTIDEEIIWALNYDHQEFLIEQVNRVIEEDYQPAEDLTPLVDWLELFEPEQVLEKLKELARYGEAHAVKSREEQGIELDSLN